MVSKKGYIIPIFVPHMGCHHKCVFCDQKIIASSISFPDVKREINDFLITRRIKDAPLEVAFFGGSFTAIPYKTQEELLKKAQPFINSGTVNSLRISTRPDAVSDEVLEFLQNYHVKTIELGVQSFSDNVLFLSKRGHLRKDIFHAVEKIKSWNYNLGLQVMPGLPGDSKKTIKSTIEDIIAIKPNFIRIYPTVVLRGTLLEKMYNSGEYTPLSLEEAVEITSDVFTKVTRHNIKVIRMGLQPTEELLFKESVVAGPFHSAFGELVKGNIALKDLCSFLDDYLNAIKKVYELVIWVPYNQISFYVGHKGVNKRILRDKYNINFTVLGSKKIVKKVLITSCHGEKEYNAVL